MHTRPDIVTLVEAFYDTSIISGSLPEGVSISIPLLAFVQCRKCCDITTLQYWIPASWTPFPGGLSSHQHCKDNRRRSEDPNNGWTKVCILGASALIMLLAPRVAGAKAEDKGMTEFLVWGHKNSRIVLFSQYYISLAVNGLMHGLRACVPPSFRAYSRSVRPSFSTKRPALANLTNMLAKRCGFELRQIKQETNGISCG